MRFSSVQAAEHSRNTLLHFVAADLVHPPLFYVFVKLWIAIGGESLLWLRLFPVLASIAAIPPFILLCRQLTLTAGQTALALLLMAINVYAFEDLVAYHLCFALKKSTRKTFRVSVIKNVPGAKEDPAFPEISTRSEFSNRWLQRRTRCGWRSGPVRQLKAKTLLIQLHRRDIKWDVC